MAQGRNWKKPVLITCGCLATLFFAIPIVLIVFMIGTMLYEQTLPKVEYVQFHPIEPKQLLLVREGGIYFWDVSDADSPRLLLSYTELDLAKEASRMLYTGLVPAAYSPDGTLAVAGSQNGAVHVIRNLSTEPELATYRPHVGRVTQIAFAPDGTAFAVGTELGELSLWDIRTGENYIPLQFNRGWVNAIAFSPDSTYFVVASGEGPGRNLLEIWSVRGDLLHAIEEPNDDIVSVAFHPSGEYFVAAADTGLIRRFAADGAQVGEPIQENVHDQAHFLLEFSKGGDYLVCAGEYTGGLLWRVDESGAFTELTSRIREKPEDFPSANIDDAVRLIRFARDGKTIAYIRGHSELYIHNLPDGPVTGPISTHKDFAISMSISADSQLIGTVGSPGSFRIWNRDGTKYADFR